jgi:hypothetical protein
MGIQQITQKEYNKLKRERKLARGKSGFMLLHGPDGHYYKHETGMKGVKAFADLKEKLEKESKAQLTLF